MNKGDLKLLFKPRNVVLYNASEKLKYFVRGFEKQGFNMDKFYLINHRLDKLFSYKCYRDINDIPTDTIDLLILAARRERVIEALEEIIKKRIVKFIHFFTAGTGESDEKGKEIENQIKDILDKSDTRAIGPNCMGLYCPTGNNAYLPIFPIETGNISLIYQSGDLHTKTIKFGDYKYGLRFSKGVSIGNCVDLQISDFLEYYNQDDETDIIGIYFEGFSQYQKQAGRNLFNTLKNMKKPILMLRGGRTQRAQTAVLTHTGTLGSPKKMWNAIYKQANIIDVGNSIDDMLDHLFLFKKCFKNPPNGKNALVILWSGGLGILNTDILTEMGINIPYFDGEIKEKMRKILPLKVGSLRNPLDLPWISRTEAYVKICKTAISEKVDLVAVEVDAYSNWDDEAFLLYYKNTKSIRDYAESLGKIFIVILPQYPSKNQRRFYRKLIDDNFIVYPSLERGARAFLALYNYYLKDLKLRN